MPVKLKLLNRVPWFCVSLLPSEIPGGMSLNFLNTRVLKVLWSAGGKRTSPPSYTSVSSSRRPECEHINRGYYLLLTTQVRIKITSIFSLILQLNHGISASG